jgi:hypothetical protein
VILHPNVLVAIMEHRVLCQRKSRLVVHHEVS